VRIDGVKGSYQLNNNVYYAKIINDFVFDVYAQPYNPADYTYNEPVEVSSYISGGYTWISGTYFLATANATATSSIDNTITVNNPTDFEIGAPVYFTKPDTKNGDTILGGLIQGKEYYVKTLDYTSGPTGKITVSNVRYDATVELTTDSGSVNATQWSQENVDRIWVSINGYRVPSSNLRLNAPNELSILALIAPEDTVTITNMIPTATPGQQVYLNTVDQTGKAAVYNANATTKTWLAKPLYTLNATLEVNDLSRIVHVVTQNVSAPVVVEGAYAIGLTANKRLITSVTIVNNTAGQPIDQAHISVNLESMAPTVHIKAGPWIDQGDSLTITTIVGNLLYVNGELIGFGSVDFATNTVGDLRRGVQGTGVQLVIPEYSVVYGMLDTNLLSNDYYNKTWNSKVYNTVLGDPLQISKTIPAAFLELDVA
jgi:hypothetical protein